MSIGLYLHALRVARARQLRARVTRVWTRRRFPRPVRAGSFAPLESVEELWRSPAFAPVDGVAGEGEVTLLGLRVPYPPADWSLPGEPRLHGFHLHYGDEVLAWARRGDVEQARLALHAWVEANPPRRGDAWHPYPLSTRVGNWTAALSLVPDLADEPVVDSLQRQLRYLARNVEDDVLGNHVIRNARGLVLGGLALDDRRASRVGLEVVRRELPEQVLPDGGHYERSPLYHLLVLRDLLEIRAASGVTWLDEPIERMRAFAAAVERPDGLPAPFNDAPLGLAPRLDLPTPASGLTVLRESGFAVVRDGPLWLAFRCGPLSPDFLPAHAHADALSFQLCWRGEPVVVDAGTSTYEPGPERDRERGTAAHSTVLVDEHDQFELWGAFRSGPLPRVELHEAREGLVEASASYRGIRHVRRLEWRDDSVTVHDRIEGEGRRRVEARFVTAAGAQAALAAADGRRLAVEEAGGAVVSVWRDVVDLPAELSVTASLR